MRLSIRGRCRSARPLRGESVVRLAVAVLTSGLVLELGLDDLNCGEAIRAEVFGTAIRLGLGEPSSLSGDVRRMGMFSFLEGEIVRKGDPNRDTDEVDSCFVALPVPGLEVNGEDFVEA